MAITDTIQLHVIDSAVAKRVLQRRTLLSYTIEPGALTTQHVIYFDTPTHDIFQTQHTLSLVISKGNQYLEWHTFKDDNEPHHIESYRIEQRQWPSAVRNWLYTHQIPVHHLIPIAHYITKSTPRRIVDQQQNELATASFVQGIISCNGNHEQLDTITIHGTPSTPETDIEAIVEFLSQHIPHRIDQRSIWQRIYALLQRQAPVQSEADAIIQHTMMLIGIQRSADEALFVPLPQHDSLANRQSVATLMCMSQQKNLALEPFCLEMDDTTQQVLAQLLPQITIPSYTAMVPPLDIVHLSFSEVLRLRLRIRLRSLLEREADVVNGFSAYDVHRIRVVLRKMRAFIECSEDIYDAEVIAQFRRGFRRMTRFLGEIRDCDAFSDHVLRILDTHQLPPQFAQGLDTIRSKALKQFQELVTDEKHQRFLQQFATFVTTPNTGNILTIQSVPKVLEQRIQHNITLLNQSHPKALIKMEDDALHDLRITAKHLRYLLEGFSDVLSPEADEAVQRLIKMQDHLGTIQDAVVAQKLLTQMRLLNSTDGKRIIQTLRQEAQQHRQSLPDLWANCQDETFRTSIQQALKALTT